MVPTQHINYTSMDAENSWSTIILSSIQTSHPPIHLSHDPWTWSSLSPLFLSFFLHVLTIFLSLGLRFWFSLLLSFFLSFFLLRFRSSWVLLELRYAFASSCFLLWVSLNLIRVLWEFSILIRGFFFFFFLAMHFLFFLILPLSPSLGLFIFGKLFPSLPDFCRFLPLHPLPLSLSGFSLSGFVSGICYIFAFVNLIRMGLFGSWNRNFPLV